MIDMKKAAHSIAALSMLKFFPSDDRTRTEITLLVCRMATTNTQIDWLVRRVLDVWNEWEGPKELRALFSYSHRPADGIEAYSALPQFQEGYPDDPSYVSVAAREPLQLTGDNEPVSKDPEMAALVERVSQSVSRRMEPDPDVDCVIRQGETEVTALARSIQEFNEKQAEKRRAYSASEAQIEFIKAEQNRNRKESGANG
jgi:hypothetical protein